MRKSCLLSVALTEAESVCFLAKRQQGVCCFVRLRLKALKLTCLCVLTYGAESEVSLNAKDVCIAAQYVQECHWVSVCTRLLVAYTGGPGGGTAEVVHQTVFSHSAARPWTRPCQRAGERQVGSEEGR